MRRCLSYLLAALLLTLSLVSCNRRGRIIPREKMADIYADMLLADQWLVDHPEARKTADTTFFYEPIFEKYGYSSRDYDASLNHYLKNPDKFATLIIDARKSLEREQKRLEKEKADSAAIKSQNQNVKRRNRVRADSLKKIGQFAGAESVAE